MPNDKHDIASPEDVKHMVHQFYDKLIADEKINRHFLPLNLDTHIPVIESFWNTILLGTQEYRNNTLQAHRHLDMTVEDFNIWLRHFETTVRENYEGDKAEEAISRANTIAWTMRVKLLDNKS